MNETGPGSGRHHGNNGNQKNNYSKRLPIRGETPPTSQHSPMPGVPYGHLPAFLPGSASLVEQLDRRVLIVLRDGRHLLGVLRSFDQFSNIVLEDTSERRMFHTTQKGGKEGHCCYYADVRLGLYLVRGDSMVLFGEVGDDAAARLPMNDDDSMKKVSLEELERLKEEMEEAEPSLDPLTWEFDADLAA